MLNGIEGVSHPTGTGRIVIPARVQVQMADTNLILHLLLNGGGIDHPRRKITTGRKKDATATGVTRNGISTIDGAISLGGVLVRSIAGGVPLHKRNHDLVRTTTARHRIGVGVALVRGIVHEVNDDRLRRVGGIRVIVGLDRLRIFRRRRSSTLRRKLPTPASLRS